MGRHFNMPEPIPYRELHRIVLDASTGSPHHTHAMLIGTIPYGGGCDNWLAADYDPDSLFDPFKTYLIPQNELDQNVKGWYKSFELAKSSLISNCKLKIIDIKNKSEIELRHIEDTIEKLKDFDIEG